MKIIQNYFIKNFAHFRCIRKVTQSWFRRENLYQTNNKVVLGINVNEKDFLVEAKQNYFHHYEPLKRK